MRKIIFMFEHYMYQFFCMKICFILLACEVLLLLIFFSRPLLGFNSMYFKLKSTMWPNTFGTHCPVL